MEGRNKFGWNGSAWNKGLRRGGLSNAEIDGRIEAKERAYRA